MFLTPPSPKQITLDFDNALILDLNYDLFAQVSTPLSPTHIR